jgi:hypothetical protein
MTLAKIAKLAEGRVVRALLKKTLDAESPALLSGLGDLREGICSARIVGLKPDLQLAISAREFLLRTDCQAKARPTAGDLRGRIF